MLNPGVLVGRYEIQRRLGRGGMGTVYVAHDPVLGRMVAVKVFLSDLELPDAVERFTREARSAAALNHPNIVTIHDYGEYASQPYIVMEYVTGETLTQIIRRKAQVSLREKLRYIEELSAGVAYAHTIGLIHRDIKPTNLMVDRSGRLKVLDFGIARMLGTLSSNATALIGTPGYMAPEQILGGVIDHRVDLFSIGVVSYELLSYADAFPGDTLPTITHRILTEEPVPLVQLVPDLQPDLAAIIQRAISKNVDDRFADVESFRSAIAAVRKQIPEEPEWSPTPTTIRTGPPAGAGRPGTDSLKKSAPDVIGVAQLTPPPNAGGGQREDVRRRRTAQIETALAEARSAFERGELETAMDACLRVLTIDEAHAAALELEQSVQQAITRKRADSLLGEVREQLGSGSLTAASDLLQRARELNPDAADVKLLEREIRLARVEQERLRQRTSTVKAAVDGAAQALERGDIETALALARQALDLDPTCESATVVEAQALHKLDEEIGPVAPATSASLSPPNVAPTVIASRAPIPSTPTMVVGDASRHARAVPARPLESTPAIVKAKQSLWKIRTSVVALLASARAAINAKSKQQKMLAVAGAAAVVLLVIAGVAIAIIARPGVVSTGTVLIDAVPWAQITDIQAEDGTHPSLPSEASTPLSIVLPEGAYRIRIVGPPPRSETKDIRVQVMANATITSPPQRFEAISVDDYFNQYLQAPASSAGAESATAPAVAPPPIDGRGTGQ